MWLPGYDVPMAILLHAGENFVKFDRKSEAIVSTAQDQDPISFCWLLRSEIGVLVLNEYTPVVTCRESRWQRLGKL